ncbi:hook-length control protein FliK [Marinospirillum celere]|uniref:Hook-length control protein FliK n=1 Tax=Marinospirillum celere TaxID=1122252 RepID=A0A1I1H1S2_9GAMM|nr:flagellar hook-length control protein FliK [Marinospirillum celere]SFC17492.1 hook-length control protein FliK [Marinospirillum celere]
MNSPANLHIFLDTQPSRPADFNKSPSAPSASKQDFEKQLQGTRHQQSSEATRSKEQRDSAQQRLDVRRKSDEQAAASKSTSKTNEKQQVADARSSEQPSNSRTVRDKDGLDGKELPQGGEKLPLPEKTSELLASLSDEQADKLLKDVSQWLQGLSDEDLEKLKQALLDGDLASLEKLLPEDLQQHLEYLASNLGKDLEDLYAGVQQLLASIQQAGVDVRQISALRSDASGLKLEMLAGNSTDQRSTAGRPEISLQETSQRSQEQGRDFSGGREELQNKRQERLEALVSRLSRGDLSSSSVNRGGGESMQQLIQAASQGLGNTVTAQPTAARMAASMPTMPSMAQATAQANAEALSNRITMMQGRGMQVAEMRLDPPDLGNLRIQIRMQGDQASVILQSPNAQARDLLENALPRLREMLEEQGLSLVDASVSEESMGDDQQGDEQGTGGGQGLASTETEDAEKIAYFEEPLGLIDYYA